LGGSGVRHGMSA